jgi:hypothetical protein
MALTKSDIHKAVLYETVLTLVERMGTYNKSEVHEAVVMLRATAMSLPPGRHYHAVCDIANVLETFARSSE